jgi:GNAT superfamily N-acetyltransferase
MLGRCSNRTRYHRFHGMTDGVSYATSLLAEGPDHESFGAWVSGRCVGLADLHVLEGGHAEIGVLVEDGWQRCGVGSELVGVLAARARQRQLRGLQAEVMADDRFILPMLARVGRTATSMASATYRVRVELDPEPTGGLRC